MKELDYSRIFLSLVHYPVYDKRRKIVTTSVTNLDIHDLARLTKSFGLGGFYIVQPSLLQRELARRIIDHWEKGAGGRYNETRRDAFTTVSLVSTLEEMEKDLKKRVGEELTTIATTGRTFQLQKSFSEVRDALEGGMSAVIMIGTGWGLTDELITSADIILSPLVISEEYNHLSVRCATAIILDRLAGR